MLVTDLEVATVTDTSVIITWFTGSATQTDSYGFPLPVAADTELQIGLVDLATLSIVPGSLKTVLQDSTPTPYHYAEVTAVRAPRSAPGGYSLLRLYTGGYMVSYYKNRTQLALAWAQRTRHEYYTLYPHYMLGTISDRNHTVTRDLSGLTPLS